MTLEEIKARLSKAGYPIRSEKRNGNDTGYQLRVDGGAIVNLFDNGTLNVQGKPAERDKVEQALAGASPNAAPSHAPKSNRVFVVYGHDTNSRSQLEAMLRRWGLDPLILDQLPSEGQTIIEKLENYTFDVHFAVVLATPDDEGHRRDHPDEKSYRARQNVVLELGMLLAKLGRSKVAVLIKDPQKMERPSDIQGIVYIPFTENLEKEAGLILAKEMDKQGFDIRVAKI
jgi:predicted nucleotide-binding protein